MKNDNHLEILQGTSYVHGAASGRLLASSTELSFWGGVNAVTSEIIDRSHPLSGRHVKDTVLAIPEGRGSCSGSATILELILNGAAPKALIFERPDQIVTLGVIVAEEVFAKSIPVVVLGAEDYSRVLSWDGSTVHVSGNRVANASFEASPVEERDVLRPIIRLSEYDQATQDGECGEASKTAMKVILRIAEMMGAHELMDINQAHIDGAFFGPGSVAFAKTLHEWGGEFRIPTTINALTIDLKRWRLLGVESEYGQQCDRLAQLFLDMGAKPSFTCAPYLLESAPTIGDTVAWGESNAVAYANSVLGARTLKNANMLECLMALTGRGPRAGLHLSDNRKASISIQVNRFFKDFDDSFWPMLGYSVGRLASRHIAVVSGLEDRHPSSDDLKAFAAAFGTTSSAPMFHLLGITPEAVTFDSVWAHGIPLKCVDIGPEELIRCWKNLNQAGSASQVDLVSLGSPHFSCKEIRKLAQLCRGRTKHPSVAVIVTSSRAQYRLAQQSGAVDELERFGVQFLTDTCWCFIEEPVILKPTRVIMTNSAKYAHYGPGLTGRRFCFGSLAQCVETACSGWSSALIPKWLQVPCPTPITESG